MSPGVLPAVALLLVRGVVDADPVDLTGVGIHGGNRAEVRLHQYGPVDQGRDGQRRSAVSESPG